MDTQLTLDGVGPVQIEMDLSQPDFHIDLSVQQRVALDSAKVEEYAELYREGRDLGPIVVFADKAAGCFLLADGFHRCQAARQAGLRTLAAEVHNGGRREALLYATSCNLHGKPLTNADKRQRVLTLLQDAEWRLWSDNHIARHCGVAHSFVRKLRDQLSVDSESSEHGDTETSQPATRQYVNKHGQVTTMQVGAIGHRNGQAACADCGRPLTDADSIRRGIRPVCSCQASAAVSASPGQLLQEADTSEPPTLNPAEQIRHAAEAWAQRQARACAEAVEHLSLLAREYGVEVVETQILAVFLAAHGRPTLANHTPQTADLAATPEGASQAIPTAPGQAPQTGLAARVREAMQAHGRKGTTASALAKALGVSNDKTWRNLERLVKQGKARKEGTTYIFIAEKEHE